MVKEKEKAIKELKKEVEELKKKLDNTEKRMKTFEDTVGKLDGEKGMCMLHSCAVLGENAADMFPREQAALHRRHR